MDIGAGKIASRPRGNQMNALVALVLAVVLVLLNGFFVAAEFSLIAARRSRIEALAREGNRRARAALACMREIPTTLSGAQLGITIASVGLGLLAEPAVGSLLESALDPLELPSGLLHGISFGVALAVVVMVHMVVGEMVPKNLALADAESVVLWVARPHRLFVTIFRPVIWMLNAMAAVILKPFGVEQVEEIGTAHTAQEFVTLIDASKSEGLIDEFSHGLLSGALDFAAHDVGSLMVPWPDVLVAQRHATVAEISMLAGTSGHSRIPIVSGRTVLGFVHAKDLLYVDNGKRHQALERGLIRTMLVVPPDLAVNELLFAMRRSQIHFALVRDDVAQMGIVTLEDILESIVGDIIDETDRIRGVDRVGGLSS
jgi:CBS domain containing-hemolysin-like protein